MTRAYYSSSISDFLHSSTEEVLGVLARNNNFDLIQTQRSAWIEQIEILQGTLRGYKGSIYFEYSIPRMGRRIDVVLLIGPVIFVLEFKVGEREFTTYALDQVCDYALDLKNFHDTSHEQYIAPILIATDAKVAVPIVAVTPQNDKLIYPIKSNTGQLGKVIEDVLGFVVGNDDIDVSQWESGRYCPTPTIIEAAIALYNNHSVADITRKDASAINLNQTTSAISEIISLSRRNDHKTICFVTGVPGAGKTLVGLDIATKHIDAGDDLYSVYLSGNGPLVKILCEALARDRVKRSRAVNGKARIGTARSDVKHSSRMFIIFVMSVFSTTVLPQLNMLQYLMKLNAHGIWNRLHFYAAQENTLNFNQSEPEFLISCMNRHPDWAVIVCLVGGGQEINTGEAGIGEWIDSISRSFPDWHICISSRLTDSEYNAEKVLTNLGARQHVTYHNELHLAVSMRSFRAEDISLLVKQMLDLEIDSAKQTYKKVKGKYPIVITRDLSKAKKWLKEQARGSERYGIIVSSQAERLRPHAINVKSPMDPVHWFLDEKMMSDHLTILKMLLLNSTFKAWSWIGRALLGMQTFDIA